AKIESLFSRLDSAKDSLERVRQEIKRYRQSVLKSAFDNLKQEKSIENVFQIIDYRGRTPPFANSGIVHLRTANIRNGQIRLENIRYVTEETYKKYMTRGIPRKGDVLMTTEAPMGEVSLIPDYKFSIAQRMVLLRSDNFDKFVMYQIMSTFFQKRLERAKTGTTVAGISSRNFKKVSFKFCSLEEQAKIVEKIESRFERAKVLENAVEQGLEKIERLKKSILKKAFEGKLVEADSNDEPVEILLERIKKEKAKLKPSR
ncbi:MAG TPA: restriction endonuclease subunit S, partial [Candidatus Omnitrophota bacterium]|nr:restriction endonuclease subunit S [Candidatus Omnitrophota bacterium]